jgi:hypothetical protein
VNRTTLTFLTVLLSAPIALCQNTAQPVIAETLPLVMGAGCPVSLQIQRGHGAMIQTAEPQRKPGQHLQLHWGNLHEKGIAGITIEVRGYDASARVIPADRSNTAALKKVFNVAVKIDGHGKATTRFTAQSFGTISWIDLQAIEYVDGSRWSLSRGETCRVAPSPLMLVAER